jgi:hypothetical protein
MIIDYNPDQRAIWHADCANHFGGVMHPVWNERTRTLMECLHCGKRGYYPVGGAGERRVEEVPPAPSNVGGNPRERSAAK